MGIFTDIFGGVDTTTARPEPWKPQQEFLEYGFNESQDLYNQKKDTPFYQGDLYAGANGMQTGGADQAWNYLQGQGGQLGQAAGAASTMALGAGGQFLDNAGMMFNQFGQDPTQQIQQSAAAYANNPFIDGQIDAASRDISRNLNENQITGLNADAAGSGNMNSSRAGMAEGIMRRGAADRIGDISAGMRGQAYQDGMGMANQQYQNQMQNQLGANMQMGQLFGSGMQGLSQVGDIAQSNFDLSQAAGGVGQQDAQGYLDQGYAQWMGADQRQQELLNNYWANIGTEYGQGSPTVDSTLNPGVINQAISAVTGGGGFVGK